MEEPSYYDVLGIAENASDDEIKKAFRRLSFVHHPDKNGNTDESTRRFQEINKAYETLSDSGKRREYDMVRQFSNMGMGGMGMGMGGFSPFGAGGGGMAMHGDDILNMLFGGVFGRPQAPMPGGGPGPRVVFQAFHNGVPTQTFHAGGGMPGMAFHGQPPGFFFPTTSQPQPQPQPPQPPQQQQPPPPPPEIIIKTASITLEQAYRGGTIPIEIDKHLPDNGGITKIEREILHVQIPRGIMTGESIIINDAGHMNEAGQRGDVKVVINITPHAIFKTDAHLDLLMEKTITLKESLCGFQFEIHHLNGKIFQLNNKGGNVIKQGAIKTLIGYGLERNGESGNLKIRFNVEFPDSFTDEQVKELQRIM